MQVVREYTDWLVYGICIASCKWEEAAELFWRSSYFHGNSEFSNYWIQKETLLKIMSNVFFFPMGILNNLN